MAAEGARVILSVPSFEGGQLPEGRRIHFDMSGVSSEEHAQPAAVPCSILRVFVEETARRKGKDIKKKLF